MRHVVDRLVERTLGELSTREQADVEGHLAACAACRAEADAMDESFTSLALAVAPIAPPPQLKARILAAAAGNGRLAHYVSLMASFFEVTTEKARALLDVIDEPEAWEAGPFPGMQLLHLSAGPRFATADCGLIRFPAGLSWPLHRHLGDESMLIFEGGIVESTGRRWGAGERIDMTLGTQHAFDVLPDGDCVCAVIVHEGIEMPPGTKLLV